MKTANDIPTLHIEDVQIKKAALVFRAINHPLRRQMVQLLHQNKQMAVNALYHALKIEQSVASQHLALLRRAGLVVTKRDARFIFYSVNYKKIEQLHSHAAQLTRGY